MLPEGASLPLRVRVLLLLALHPDGLYAYKIMKELGVSSGSLYPALGRLLGAGHLRTVEGPIVEHRGVERPQKLYVVTNAGLAFLRELRQQLAVPTPSPTALSSNRGLGRVGQALPGEAPA